MIEKISAIDRDGNILEYNVLQEPMLENGYSGIRYMVSRPELGRWKFFEIQTLDISNDRVMIYMLLTMAIVN